MKTTSRRRWPSPFVVVSVGLIISYFLAGLATLTVFPLVGVDESWYTESAWSFATDGTFALPMFADLAGFDRDNVVYGRLYLLAMAAAFWVGDASVAAVRAVSLVSGLVVVLAVLGAGRELWSPRVGWTAALLLAIAPSFVWQSHHARPEILLLAMWTTALYLVLSGTRIDSRWRIAAGGLAAGFAVDVHFNAAILTAALFFVMVARRASVTHMALYLGGLSIAFVWWIWIHVIPDPALLQAQMDAFTIHDVPLLDLMAAPWKPFVLEAMKYLEVIPRSSVLLVLVAVVAAIVLLRAHRDRALLALLTLVGSSFAMMAVLLPHRFAYYGILLWPAFALLVARMLDVLPRRSALAIGSMLVLVSLATIGQVVVTYLSADYEGYIAKLRAYVEPGATVQADPELWYGFADHPFVASHYFVLAGSYGDEVRRLGVDYVLLDEPTFGDCPACPEVREVLEFLPEHAELVAVVHDPFYGRLAADGGQGWVTPIYRITE